MSKLPNPSPTLAACVISIAAMLAPIAHAQGNAPAQEPRLDEKIHDSNAAGNDVGRAIDVDKLAARLETFVQAAAETAVAGTLGGRVEAGEIKTVPASK